ncbi:MAG: hypothetical protein A3H31_11795 [Gallionellales bacterium RIFCSPLOWO2_02_FULL_57_47]|nr:MAG: hypothetical protein A3H31_11795 [Gallionellales bacterium RIFCSPLOWO2_02_FULL_57_47]OGT14215.1 MAG: hypothetical protein A3J49_06955 [Gallionellales bacterium RIFCSPHIGHO2_02_FULL_57_16]
MKLECGILSRGNMPHPVFAVHSRITPDGWPLIEWPNADAGTIEMLVVDRSVNAALERLVVVAKTT